MYIYICIYKYINVYKVDTSKTYLVIIFPTCNRWSNIFNSGIILLYQLIHRLSTPKRPNSGQRLPVLEPFFCFPALVGFPLDRQERSFKNYTMSWDHVSNLYWPCQWNSLYICITSTSLPIRYLKVQWWIPQEDGLHWLFISNLPPSAARNSTWRWWSAVQNWMVKVVIQTVINDAS